MADLSLSYAGLLYLDRTLALLTGEVLPRNVTLHYHVFPRVEELFRRQARQAEFDVAEMSMSTFLVLTAHGDRRFIGLPVFPSRHFRHREVYVSTASNVRSPEDLRGKRIGVPEYQMTAAVWVRAFLERDYQVFPKDLTWFTGGLRDPAYEARLPFELPGIDVQRIPEGETLEGMLRTGDLDVLITTEPPPYFSEGQTEVVRLFANYGTVERDYYARTGLFPIMHVIVVRRDIYAANPWVAVSLTEAFAAAQAFGRRQLRFRPSLPVSLPWLQESVDELDSLFDGDAFPIGVDANRHILEALSTYAFEQGLTNRPIAVDELFAEEVLHTRYV